MQNKTIVLFSIVITVLSLAFSIAQAAEPNLSSVHRIQVALDDGSAVTVDNASKMPDQKVNDLVLAADRSTQTGSPFTQKAKGLFNRGDRIFVSDYYIAWFDYTIGDGVAPPPRWPTFSRSGDLAGLWSLDPETQNFRYPYKTISKLDKEDSSKNISWNWARNELIPGSNSRQARTIGGIDILRRLLIQLSSL